MTPGQTIKKKKENRRKRPNDFAQKRQTASTFHQKKSQSDKAKPDPKLSNGAEEAEYQPEMK